MRTLFYFTAAFLSCITSMSATDKMYIDTKELNYDYNTFRIHVGENNWIQTPTVHRDETGLYTFESDILKDIYKPKMGYEKTWKCPYCFRYWPIGKSCQNSECPSKYR